jgi:hypothetical protein
MISVKLAEPIPLFVILEDGATDRVVKADIINPYTGVALHSDLSLSYVATSEGHYRYAIEIFMPDTDNLLVVYRVYEADGTTLIGKDSETVVLAVPGGAGGGSSASSSELVVAVIDDDPIIATVGEAL